jgi:hypothetical protein
MTFVRTFFSIAALTTATLAMSAGAASDELNDSHHPAATGAIQIAQAATGSPGMGMGGTGGMGAMATAPGHADQMKAMQQMHEKMLAAKTPAERNALMAEHMTLMQNGMNMMGGIGGMAGMGGMGASAAPGKPADMAARQGMMEQRMDMMQSMMQMMMDRMQSVPVTK